MTPSTIGSLTPGQQTPDVTAPTEAQRKAARDFEAIFLRQLLSSLEKGSGLGAKQSSGGEVFRSMMVSALADTAAEGGGIGLSEVILKAMLPPAPAGVPNVSTGARLAPDSPQPETRGSPLGSSRLGSASPRLTESPRRLMFGGVRGESTRETFEAPFFGAPREPEPPRWGGSATSKPRPAGVVPNGAATGGKVR